MFTGLIEIMGTISSIQEQDNTESGGNGWTITVSDAPEILTDCHLGDSIAINGKMKEDLVLYNIKLFLTCLLL
jgi:riboflavin synthase